MERRAPRPTSTSSSVWADLVGARGGVAVAGVGELLAARLDGAAFLAVIAGDEGTLPLVAKLTPAQAAAFLLLGSPKPVESEPGAAAAAANRLLERLEVSGRDAYLLKAGRVGGTDPERSIEVREEHVAAILDAVAAGAIEWEGDPDFGYGLATEVPGIEGRDQFLLIPRFLYARTERVYEYAALVPELKRQRFERLSALAGLDPAIIDAVR